MDKNQYEIVSEEIMKTLEMIKSLDKLKKGDENNGK